MAKPTPKGRMHEVFTDRVEDLRRTAQDQHDAARDGGPRPWWWPTDGAGPFDLEGMIADFDRAGIDANYAECLADPAAPGTVGDVVSLRHQAAVVAALERAHRARHASPVRLAAFAAARRRGHGHDAGVLAGVWVRAAQDALTAASQR